MENVKRAPDEDMPRAPYQPTDSVLIAAEMSCRSTTVTRKPNPGRQKNYKGQYVKEKRSVRLTRPHIIDTRNIAIKLSIPEKKDTDDKKVFTNVKKVDTGIKIKLLPEVDKSKKRIVLKNPK